MRQDYLLQVPVASAGAVSSQAVSRWSSSPADPSLVGYLSRCLFGMSCISVTRSRSLRSGRRKVQESQVLARCGLLPGLLVVLFHLPTSPASRGTDFLLLRALGRACTSQIVYSSFPDFPYYYISRPVYQQEQQLLFKEPHVPRAPQEPQQLICD